MIRKTRLIVAVLALLSMFVRSSVAAAGPSLHSVQQGSITSEDLTITLGDSWQTQAKLAYPAGQPGRLPVVILVHGSGPNDLDHTIALPGADKPISTNFRAIAEYFSARGIAVLRFNKRYVSGPGQVDGGKFGKLTLSDHVADIEQVLSVARAHPKVDPKRIFLYGWSEGSLTATEVAVRNPTLAGLILQGAVARTDRDYYITDYTDVVLPYVLSFSSDGKISSQTLKAAQAGNGGIFTQGVLFDFTDPSATGDPQVNPFFDKNSDGVLDPETEIRPNLSAWVDLLMLPGGILAFATQLPSVANQAPKLKLPVLVLQGEHDAAARSTNIGVLNQAFAGAVDFTLKVYSGLGHGLSPVSGRQTDDFGPIQATPMDDTLNWIAARTAAPASLPNTGSDTLPVWMFYVLAGVIIALGGVLRIWYRRRLDDRAGLTK